MGVDASRCLYAFWLIKNSFREIPSDGFRLLHEMGSFLLLSMRLRSWRSGREGQKFGEDWQGGWLRKHR